VIKRPQKLKKEKSQADLLEHSRKWCWKLSGYGVYSHFKGQAVSGCHL